MCIAHAVKDEVMKSTGQLNRRAFLRGSVGVGVSVGALVAALSATSGLSVVSAQGDDSVEANLARFDTLDFDAYSKQDWDLFAQIHAPDVVVFNPDGHETDGIKQHIAESSWIFSWTPDHKIIEHPIRFGSGDWTAVSSVATGTFTKPIAMPDGSMVPPTGLAFKFTFATLALWKDGRIAQEGLFGEFNGMVASVMGTGAQATSEATPEATTAG